VDWSWHVSEHTQASPDGEAPLHTLVAEVAGAPLPPDRPLWRVLVVPAKGARRSAVIMVAHYDVADGINVIAEALASTRSAPSAAGSTSRVAECRDQDPARAT
jgi:hypothetical protein